MSDDLKEAAVGFWENAAEGFPGGMIPEVALQEIAREFCAATGMSNATAVGYAREAGVVGEAEVDPIPPEPPKPVELPPFRTTEDRQVPAPKVVKEVLPELPDEEGEAVIDPALLEEIEEGLDAEFGRLGLQEEVAQVPGPPAAPLPGKIQTEMGDEGMPKYKFKPPTEGTTPALIMQWWVETQGGKTKLLVEKFAKAGNPKTSAAVSSAKNHLLHKFHWTPPEVTVPTEGEVQDAAPRVEGKPKSRAVEAEGGVGGPSTLPAPGEGEKSVLDLLAQAETKFAEALALVKAAKSQHKVEAAQHKEDADLLEELRPLKEFMERMAASKKK